MEQDKSSCGYFSRITCETWKPIKGYEGIYEISSHGRVRSIDRIGYQRHYSGCQSRYFHKGQIIKPTKSRDYLIVHLMRNGENKTFSIHRLVATHFIEKPSGKNYINHLDSNPKNNHVENLEWCTQSENIKYAYDQGRKIPPHMRKIEQYDKDGNFIRLWNSETEIEREIGVYQANIYKVCSGKRQTAGGYIWKYAE